jgi:hypothetical protein
VLEHLGGTLALPTVVTSSVPAWGHPVDMSVPPSL